MPLVSERESEYGGKFLEYMGDPEECKRAINASRRRGFCIRCEYSLYTTEGMAYPGLQNVRVTQAEAMRFCDDAIRFRKLKAEQHPDTPEEDLPKLRWTVCDNLIFVGG